jgi:hypothetical protein
MNQRKLRQMLRSQLPSLVLWIPFVLVGLYFDAALPKGGMDGWLPSNAWQNFITFVLIINFLWTKAWLLIRRMPYVDWLTISLASVNWNFVAIYLFALALMTWPLFFYQIVSDQPPPQLKWWAQDVLILLRTLLIVNLIWSTYLLAIQPDPEDDDV